MTFPTLTAIAPSYDSSQSEEYRSREVEYDGGYSVVVQEGLNPTRRIYNVRWDNIPVAEGQAILAFLNGRVGRSFLWTPPLEDDPVQWRSTAPNHQIVPGNAVMSISATFRQSFDK